MCSKTGDDTCAEAGDAFDEGGRECGSGCVGGFLEGRVVWSYGWESAGHRGFGWLTCRGGRGMLGWQQATVDDESIYGSFAGSCHGRIVGLSVGVCSSPRLGVEGGRR